LLGDKNVVEGSTMEIDNGKTRSAQLAALLLTVAVVGGAIVYALTAVA
jgi:hypothetical protein